MSTITEEYCPCDTCDNHCEASKKMASSGLKIIKCVPDKTGTRVTTSHSDMAGGVATFGYRNCHFKW